MDNQSQQVIGNHRRVKTEMKQEPEWKEDTRDLQNTEENTKTVQKRVNFGNGPDETIDKLDQSNTKKKTRFRLQRHSDTLNKAPAPPDSKFSVLSSLSKGEDVPYRAVVLGPRRRNQS